MQASLGADEQSAHKPWSTNLARVHVGEIKPPRSPSEFWVTSGLQSLTLGMNNTEVFQIATVTFYWSPRKHGLKPTLYTDKSMWPCHLSISGLLHTGLLQGLHLITGKHEEKSPTHHGQTTSAFTLRKKQQVVYTWFIMWFLWIGRVLRLI